MDLVEIRKKAKSRKKVEPVIEETALPVEEVETPVEPILEPPVEPPAQDPVASEGGADAEPIPVADEVQAVPEQVPEPPVEPLAEEPAVVAADEIDPIDALFSFVRESGFASEDNYLQALVGGDEVLDEDIQQWLTFSLGEEEYALTIESVSEIIKPREVTDIPRVPAFIKGIISLRGIIVPVFDLNRRLNLETGSETSSARIIVCQDGERLAGFLVDRINQVVNIPLTNIEPPPTVLSGLDRDFVDGVGRIDGKMLILLHLSNVINAELL